MKYVLMVLAITAVLLLSSCTPGDKERGFFGGSSDKTGVTFIGGTTGVLMTFTDQRPPEDVFAGGDDPFDVEVEVVNDGEWTIKKEDVTIVLTGVDPNEFSKTQAAFVKHPDIDMDGKHLDVDGNNIEGLPQYVLFENLNHADSVIGTLEFPLRAEACYAYGTSAVSQLCYKEDLRRDGGVCDLGEKDVHVSGSPIQIKDFKQTAVSATSFAFSFVVEHKGNGQVYQKGECSGRTMENKVFVKVETGSEALTCSGLRGGTTSEGFLDLRAGDAVVRCRQDVRGDIRGAFVKPVSIEATFNYKESVSTQINVKQSEI